VVRAEELAEEVGGLWLGVGEDGLDPVGRDAAGAPNDLGADVDEDVAEGELAAWKWRLVGRACSRATARLPSSASARKWSGALAPAAMRRRSALPSAATAEASTLGATARHSSPSLWTRIEPGARPGL
jgi:hypothetical protein